MHVSFHSNWHLNSLCVWGGLNITVLARTFDWEAEADLSFLEEEATTATPPFSASELPKGTIFLLTGATGFLGRFVLWELVSHECCGLVYCLSRRNKSKLCADLYIHVHAYIIHTCIYICLYTCTYMYIHTCIQCTYMHTCCTCPCTYIHTYVHTMYMHTYYVHTYVQWYPYS